MNFSITNVHISVYIQTITFCNINNDTVIEKPELLSESVAAQMQF